MARWQCPMDGWMARMGRCSSNVFLLPTRQTMEEQQFCVAAAMCYQPHPQHGKPWRSNNFVLLLRCVISPTHNTANHGAATILCCCSCDVLSAPQYGKPLSSNNFVLLLRCFISPTTRQTMEHQQFCVAVARSVQNNMANRGAAR